MSKHRLPAHVKPERYKLLIRPDFENFTFYGEETIFLTLDKTSKQIALHSADIEIESAEFLYDSNETWAGKISYNPKAETATFTFPKNVEKGKGVLKLKFRGILNDKMRGFYRSKFDHNGQIKHLAVTQFESTDARRAFPCFDEPAQKAIFDVTLMIPKNMRAISNTIESQILEHESGLKIVEFESTPKMSTYILAFLIGEFEYLQGRTKDGVLVRVFTTPGKKIQAKFALDLGIKCLEFYNSYFGIDYPLPVLDMIAIPDFAAGAMENWGAVAYRESALLVDREKSSTANKQWVALVIAHELAHMWFGNLVTMEWWTHLWLNEGFASFIEYLAIDHIFPEWEVWNQFMALEMGTAFSLDGLKNTHPIEVEVGHPAEISEIFDKVSYSKGASILRMLHEYLGENDFKKGLQHYLKKYSYDNAQTEDLWKSLEEVSEREVTRMMKNWTSKSGHPLVSVKLKVKSAKLELTQSRFFSSPKSRKESKDRTIWSIPLMSLRASAKQSSKLNGEIATGRTAWCIPRNDKGWLMDKKVMNIDKPKDDGWIKLNAGETSLVRVDYPHEYLKRLMPAVINKQISAPDRLGLIRDVFGLAQSGQTPTNLALELALSFKQEEDYIVWSELVKHFSQLNSLLAYEDFYENFRSFGRQIYKPIAQKLGWSAKKREKHSLTLLRSMVLLSLGYFGDEEIILYCSQIFKKFLEDGTKINPDLKSVVYNLVAKNGGIDQYQTLIELYKKDDNQQEKERIGRCLGLFKSKEILQKTLNFAISEHVRYQNSLGIIASVWGNPQGRYLAWGFVKENWKLLKERYAGGHIFSRVFIPAGDFTKKEDAKDIETFVKINPTPEAQRTIAQALEQIYSNAEWLKRDREEIRRFLAKFVCTP